MKEMLWCYSFDGSNFKSDTFASMELAIEDAKKEADDDIDTIYVGQCETHHNERFFPDADIITEHMCVNAEDVGGDFANDYPDVTKEAEEELTQSLHKLLKEWCIKHDVSPSFYSVINSQKVNLR